MYPHESDNTMLFPLLILAVFTLFVGFIGSPLVQGEGEIDLNLLSKWLAPSKNLKEHILV